MEKFDESADPLDLAFAHPKAGKKLKPGEVLPGLEGVTSQAHTFDERMPEPDAHLSRALDDAFSNPNFGAEPPAAIPEPAYSENAAAIEAKLARDLDDAFANPKVGNKIEEGTALNDLGLGRAGLDSPSLNTPRLEDMHHLDHAPVKSGGMFSPKFLVIAMILAAVVIAAVMGGVETTASQPTRIQLD